MVYYIKIKSKGTGGTMKIGKLLGLILAVLFFSMIQVQAETWSAGPALIPGEKSKFYESTELRFRTSVAKIPVYKGKNTVFQERFNEKMRKEGNHYLLALHGGKIKKTFTVTNWYPKFPNTLKCRKVRFIRF